MSRILRNLLCKALYAAMIISPCVFGEEQVSVYGDWSVLMEPPGICYARSKSIKEDASEPGREENYVQVSMFPQMKWYDKVFVIPGYTYKEDSAVYVRVDNGDKYQFGQDGYKSFAIAADQSRLVDEMKRGRILAVEGVSVAGHATRDTYSLEDFPSAYEKVASLCNVTPRAENAESVRDVDVGGLSIKVMPPVGLVDIHGEAGLTKAFEDDVEPNVMVLSGFVTDADLLRWQNGQDLDYKKYAQVLAAKVAYGVDVNQMAFKQAVEMSKTIDKTLPRAFLEVDIMNNTITVNPDIKTYEISYVETLSDTPTSYCTVQMRNMGDGYLILTSDTALLLKNRTFNIQVAIQGVGVKQLEWLEMVTRKWIADLQAANR